MHIKKRTGKKQQIKYNVSKAEAETIDEMRKAIRMNSDTSVITFVITLHELGYITLKQEYLERAEFNHIPERRDTPRATTNIYQEDLELLKAAYPRAKRNNSARLRACLYAAMEILGIPFPY